MDYTKTAESVLSGVGGADNVVSVVNCATRLRFVLKDRTLADDAAVKATKGVITVAEAGGQFQVVIGNEVRDVRAAIGALEPRLAELSDGAEEAVDPDEPTPDPGRN